MNRQDIDIYVVLPQGTYLYDAKGHKLNLISEGDHRSAVAGGQAFVNNAPVSLVLVSDLSKLGYLVRGAVIALRNEDADKVPVSEIKN